MLSNKTLGFFLSLFFGGGSMLQASHESIIPHPTSYKILNGSFRFNPIINYYGLLDESIKRDLEELHFGLCEVSDKKKAHLVLEISGESNKNPESYAIDIKTDQVIITAPTELGQFWAVQSLKQLILQNPHLACAHIKDQPRFSYRGMHLDVARHMFSVNDIKKYIDLMALYKFNTFHWHLTDDQGWRVEIKSHPKLQSIAAFRKETVLNTSWQSEQMVFDGKSYGGYYTQDEIKEIVSYANLKKITIIPEIDMPGHCLAVLAAYPELACHNKPFEVGTYWMISEDILCASNEKVYQFMEDVLSEIIDLFPSKYIHIGGDEVPKQSWQSCHSCQDLIKHMGLKDENQLQGYFIKKIEKILAKKGKIVIGWDEILDGQLEKSTLVMAWTKKGERAKLAASRGHNVIVCPQKPLYFDHYQSHSDTEPCAIGGFNSLSHVYHFNPFLDGLDSKEKKLILGIQANVWTEFMPTYKHVEYMACPRLIALAEVAWSQNSKKNYSQFLKRLKKQKNILDFYQVNYARHDMD